MKEQNDFYIGWKDDMPPDNKRFLKKILIPLFILIPVLLFAIVFFQKPFNNHQFEFGNIKTISGIYYDMPVPMLIADKGTIPDSLSHDIILVGYGKFGAKGIMSEIEKEKGRLNGKKISLSGTLIYGDGKTLLELTEEKASLKAVANDRPRQNPTLSGLKDISLYGEVIDPKCYFGVMKPGEGKTHKSCAIRCISGGIPPVFKHKKKEAGKNAEYYLILNRDGKAINKEILPLVAEQITLKGKTHRFLSWNLLYLDTQAIKDAMAQ